MRPQPRTHYRDHLIPFYGQFGLSPAIPKIWRWRGTTSPSMTNICTCWWYETRHNWSYSAQVLCKFQLHKSDMSYESCASVLHKPQSVDVIVNPTSMAHRRSHGENTRPLEWSVSQMVQHKWSFLWFLPSSKGLWITEQSRCWILVDCSNCIIYPGCGTFPRSNFTKRRLEDRG